MRDTKFEKEVKELLRSGDFTIAYHDNGQCSLYKGRHKYDDLPKEEFASFDMNDNYNGYAPAIVVFLVKALKGRCESI
jgi:hypothetical protein